MKICIEKLGDGTYSVYNDDGSEAVLPAGGMQSGMQPGMSAEEEPKGESFASVDEALEAARSMLSSDGMGGVMAPEKPMIEGESDFVGGFKKARGMDQGY